MKGKTKIREREKNLEKIGRKSLVKRIGKCRETVLICKLEMIFHNQLSRGVVTSIKCEVRS